MSKTFWIIIAAVIVLFGSILLLKGHTVKGTPTHHVIGNGSTGVLLVEYGDYECPYCGAFAPIVKQVQQKYNGQITFQFRNLPLPASIHPDAFAAARAAEAAALQNKFWEMHDLLYSKQDEWVKSSDPQATFEQYATQLGLNLTKFRADFSSSTVNANINADVDEFNKTGNEESTPTFFLDGKKIQPGYNVSDFSKLIDAEIAAKAKH